MSYKDVKRALAASATGDKASRRYSKGDLVDLTRAALNEPDGGPIYNYYSNPSGDTPVSVEKKPVEAYRNALKDVVKQFGVDGQEAEKINTIDFSKKHAEAMIDVVQAVQADYTDTGKKLRLPQFSADSTTVTLSKETLPEKTEDTKKNTVIDGKTVQVPTGKTIRTEQRTVIKASNKVPGWLKHQV